MLRDVTALVLWPRISQHMQGMHVGSRERLTRFRSGSSIAKSSCCCSYEWAAAARGKGFASLPITQSDSSLFWSKQFLALSGFCFASNVLLWNGGQLLIRHLTVDQICRRWRTNRFAPLARPVARPLILDWCQVGRSNCWKPLFNDTSTPRQEWVFNSHWAKVFYRSTFQ